MNDTAFTFACMIRLVVGIVAIGCFSFVVFAIVVVVVVVVIFRGVEEIARCRCFTCSYYK